GDCRARGSSRRALGSPRIALLFMDTRSVRDWHAWLGIERLIRSALRSLLLSRRDLDPRLGTSLDHRGVVFGARTVVPGRSRCRWTRRRVGLVVLPRFG